MAGRGAWNVAGLGGTRKYKDSTKVGPYYYIGTGVIQVNGNPVNLKDPNQYAVKEAVKHYQAALNRHFGRKRLAVDGEFGNVTAKVLTEYQNTVDIPDTTPWGGIGPDTSKSLLYPELKEVHKNRAKPYTPLAICSGTIRHESNWDAGAVGYIDPNDVGLAQINAQAHPEWDVDERLTPRLSFQFIVDRYNADIPYFKGNVRDAVAAYNLGRGGANSWIRAGRPDEWRPTPGSAIRFVNAYIDSILKG
jgi:hypothetical protein